MCQRDRARNVCRLAEMLFNRAQKFGQAPFDDLHALGCQKACDLTPDRRPRLTPLHIIQALESGSKTCRLLGSMLNAERGALPHQ
jgi:hypothetical protein